MAISYDKSTKAPAELKTAGVTRGSADARHDIRQLKADFEAKARVLRRELHTLKAKELQ